MATITKTKAGTYRLQWRDKYGRQVSKTFKKRSEAVDYRDGEMDVSSNTAAARQSVEYWAMRWLGTLTVRPRTKYDYERKLHSQVLPRLGKTPVGEVDRYMCKQFVAWMEGKGYAPSTIRHTIAVLSGVLQTAVDAGALRDNPARELDAPSPRRKELRVLTRAEIVKLADVAGGVSGLVIRLAAWTGLRAGEIWGLQVRDIDVENCTVTVARSYSRRFGYHMPKSGKQRKVGVPSALRDELGRLVEGRGPTEPLFATRSGTPVYHVNFMHRQWKKATADAGFDGLRFHDLRHTYASLLIARGMGPVDIMHRMGHSTITLTINTYGHLFPDTDRDSTEWLADTGEGAAA